MAMFPVSILHKTQVVCSFSMVEDAKHVRFLIHMAALNFPLKVCDVKVMQGAPKSFKI